MNQPLGLDDFFVLEAGEYLGRLGTLAASAAPPSGEELVRFTRALRGSALMANQPAIARAANALEHLLRGYRDGRLEWTAELPARTREAVDVLRTLVERVRTWTPDDAARAERLALELEQVSGGGSARPAPPPGAQSDAGVRAFLARESAALGSALDQTAKSLATGTTLEDVLAALVRRLLPLRGLAALTDFPPLPDLLDGIERTAVSLSRLELPPHAGAERLAAAADALVRAAREIADRGRPDPHGQEFQRFAGLLLHPGADADSAPVVDIESLYFAGEDGLVKRGLAPRPELRQPLAAAAVVSRGEHLVQAADELAEASSTAQRDLRLHVLLQDLRTLAAGLPSVLDVSVEAFAAAARSAILRGAAASEALRFADCIRDAGTRLRGYTEITQPATLAAGFEPLVTRLERLGSAVAPPPAIAAVDRESLAIPHAVAPPEVPAEPAVVPIESLAPDPEPAPEPVDPYAHLPIVPIESLAPDEEPVAVAAPLVAPTPVLAAAPVPLPGDDGWDIAASFARYESLVAGVSAAPVVTPALAAAGASAVTPADTVVEIGELLYHGRAALERAEELRRELRALNARAPALATLQPLVDELLDLVELAIAD
ncbi:MAG: Hpt domain-containing protein [Gemmatimonadetes bacterium]|nr:Hpt domain-containing protein [Gemmatimonadota bacterium]